AERAQEALADELDVVAALAQVRIVHRREPLGVRVDRARHRPLDAPVLDRDLLAHGLGERLVADHQHVRFQDGRLRALRLHAARHVAQALLSVADGDLVTRELDVDLPRLDVAVGVRLLRRAEHDRLADRDAGRARDAAQQLRPGGTGGGGPRNAVAGRAERAGTGWAGGHGGSPPIGTGWAGGHGGSVRRDHSGSPKRSAMSRPMASTTPCGSAPRARTSIVVPWEPHSRSTPMTLLALALCPSGPA